MTKKGGGVRISQTPQGAVKALRLERLKGRQKYATTCQSAEGGLRRNQDSAKRTGHGKIRFYLNPNQKGAKWFKLLRTGTSAAQLETKEIFQKTTQEKNQIRARLVEFLEAQRKGGLFSFIKHKKRPSRMSIEDDGSELSSKD